MALLTEDEEFDEDTAMMMMLLAMHEEEEQQRHRDAPLDGDEREPRGVLFCTTECVVFWCINAPFYSLLFGYIKHRLKKYC